MLIWKTTETLRDLNDPEWELLSKLVLGDSIHADRKTGFLLSREALRHCLEESGFLLPISELILSGFSALNSRPELTLSLSHTKTHGAAILADRIKYRSVGIDIESDERDVKDSIIERIRHEHDQMLRKIELWCVKEAVFKAAMNTGLFPAPVEFSSLLISDKTWSHSPSKLQGEWDLSVIRNAVVARAWLKN